MHSKVIVEFLLEVDFFVSLVGHDCILTRLPVGRANFTVLICELECFDQAERLINRSADGIVVDLH